MKRLTAAQKEDIWKYHQSGLVSREIALKVGCSFVTVCQHIKAVEQTSCKRRKPCRPKPHSPHKSHRRKQKSSEQIVQDRKILELYQKLQSATKVVKELKKEGIELSTPTILKRVRD